MRRQCTPMAGLKPPYEIVRADGGAEAPPYEILRNYDSRKATIGSTCVARIAGTTLATRPTAARATATTTKVAGSRSSTWNNIDRTNDVRASAAPTPITTPATTGVMA